MVTSMDVVKHAMQGINGLTITSTYRDPKKNKKVGGSKTSHHLNHSNPAVDIAGDPAAMRQLADKLETYGYDAELLYGDSGHKDHVHFALRSTDAPPPEEAAGSVRAADGSGHSMSIKELQEKLKAHGYDPGPIDGFDGPKTQAALKEFQNENGLTPDGVVGPKTSAALGGGDGGDSGKSGSGDDDRTVDEIIAEEYPSMVWALDHPELGPLLREAEEWGWTPLKLNNELQGTEWWTKSSGTRRQLEVMKQTDPATYRETVTMAHRRIQTMAQDIGVELEWKRVKEIGNQHLYNNFDDRTLTQMILGRVDLTDEEFIQKVDEGGFGGAVSAASGQVEDVSNSYLLDLTPADKRRWVNDIVAGNRTKESFREYAEEMAIAQMPFLQQFIDRGLSPVDGLRPYQQTFAQMLEINPETVNWKDERFQRVLRVQDGKDERLATTSEAARRIRQEFNQEWQQTNGARQTAVQLTTEIADMFGRRA